MRCERTWLNGFVGLIAVCLTALPVWAITPTSIDYALGVPTNGNIVFGGTSGDGDRVLIGTNTVGLVPEDTSADFDYFLFQRSTNSLTLVLNNISTSVDAILSHDGESIFFSSSNALVPSDSNGQVDIYQYHIQTDTFEQVTSGGNGRSVAPKISHDGSVVLFRSTATNWIASDNNGLEDLFVLHRNDGTIVRISENADGDGVNNASFFQYNISGDGSRVVFDSLATNLVPNDNNNRYDLFSVKSDGSELRLLSQNSNGEIGNGSSLRPSISNDGNQVLFDSSSNNLLDGVSGTQVYLFDHQLNQLSIVNFNSDNERGNSTSFSGVGNSNSGWIAFATSANNFADNDGNQTTDIVVRHLPSGQAALISQPLNGVISSTPSSQVHLSNDGLTAFVVTPAGLLGEGNGSQAQVYAITLSLDGDNDGIDDHLDNCPTIANPAQQNSDGDNQGDQCDASPNTDNELIDSDGDNVPDYRDNCPRLFNNQSDRDFDGVGDSCDQFPFDGLESQDSDFDGIGDRYDAFPNNTDQSADSDGDGIPNSSDPAPFDSNNDGVNDLIRRVNISSQGAEANAFTQSRSDISSDGQWVVFLSRGNNLTPLPTYGYASFQRAYLHNRRSGQTTLLDPQLEDANVSSVAISDDGSKAAFITNKRMLPADTNGFQDVYLLNLTDGALELASKTPQGMASNGHSSDVQLSGDGSRVIFRSNASGLVADDSNNLDDLFVYDSNTQVITRISQGNDGTQITSGSFNNPSLNFDGSVAIFATTADSLVATDNDGLWDIFAYDFSASDNNYLTQVSTSSTGDSANQSSLLPSVSANGRFVAFRSLADNLVAGASSDLIYRKDRQTGDIIVVSKLGALNANGSILSSISDDGNRIAFTSTSSFLVPGDNNNRNDIFVADLSAGSVELISKNAFSEQLASPFYFDLKLAGSGNVLTFSSNNAEWVANDTNGQTDIFSIDIPSGSDSDSDGVDDLFDNCPVTPNPRQDDADADGLGNLCDDDDDNDGLLDGDDNCPTIASTDQTDGDNDGIGDVCDSDRDNDGVPNLGDAFPDDPNENADIDGDGQGDNSDPWPGDPQNDADGDNIAGNMDNCPTNANPDQADLDGDYIGDACDPDQDGDNVADNVDAFDRDSTEWADQDGDGIGDNTDPMPLDANFDGITDLIQRISITSIGVEGDDRSTMLSPNSLSADGDKVVFVSRARSFHRDGWSGATAYLYQRSTQQLTQLTNYENVLRIAISGDGNTIAIETTHNLVAEDNNGRYDIYVRLLSDSDWQLVSRHSNGTIGDNNSSTPKLSFDGSKVLYNSLASNLIDGDVNGRYDLFFTDLNSGQTKRLSQNSSSVGGTQNTFNGNISGDGNTIVFESFADNLVADDTNNTGDLFIYDVQNDSLTRLLTDTDQQPNGRVFEPALSFDGNILAFSTWAANMGTTNNRSQIIRLDRSNNLRQVVSADATGILGNNSSSSPNISYDGQRITFSTGASNLINGFNGTQQLVIFNAASGGIQPISRSATGALANQSTSIATISGNGNDVVIQSRASNLVGYDANNSDDIFALDLILDVDGDGIPDDQDFCPLDPDPDQLDSDSDGINDVCDPFPLDGANDIDGDGISGHIDNCPTDANADQADFDGDSVGDVCDSDRDGDGVDNGSDAFPDDPTETLDSDADGVGDNSDAFPFDPNEISDSDGDGVGDSADSFPNDPNASADSDGDGVSDPIDIDPNDGTEVADTDGDGTPDNQDSSPYDSNGDLRIDELLRISLRSDNAQGLRKSTIENTQVISDDGNKVLFISQSTNFNPNRYSGDNLYLYQRDSRTLTALTEVEGATINSAALSADGNSAAVVIDAPLTAADTDANSDVYLIDISVIDSPVFQLIAVQDLLTPVASTAFTVSISGDGQRVLFSASLDDPQQAGSTKQLYLYEPLQNTTTRLTFGFYEVEFGVISADGNWVAFHTNDINATLGDLNSVADVYLFEIATANYHWISDAGASGLGDSEFPSISSDGRFITYETLHTGLVGNQDSNNNYDVVLYDHQTQMHELISVNTAGISEQGESFAAVASDDGNLVVFASSSNDLLTEPRPDNGLVDIYLRNRSLGITTLVSQSSLGLSSQTGDADIPTINGSGNTVVFQSAASELVANDVNNVIDLFAWTVDRDGDGIGDGNDNCPAIANEDQANLDGDEFGDLCDNDRDGDGVDNGSDAFPDNALESADSDGDGLGDNSDPFPLDAANDADGDGISGHIDNCPAIANEDQANLDGDAFGDLCDDDRDGDGVDNGNDAFPDDANESADSDGDGQGDNSDPFPQDAANDADGDGVSGHIDNCPAIANEDQANLDGDQFGDVCDGDRDGDNVANFEDRFPDDGTEVFDSDGDGIGDNGDPLPWDRNQDGETDDIRRISVRANGNQSTGVVPQFYGHDVSADGNSVVFISDDGTMSPTGSITFNAYLYLRGSGELIALTDNLFEATERVVISADGSTVALQTSDALTNDDSNSGQDIYLYDVATQTFTLASRGAAGGDNQQPSISADGRYTVFTSTSPAAGGSDGQQVLLYDRDIDSLAVITSVNGAFGNGNATTNPVISADGSVIAYASNASNLVGNDTNNERDLFVHYRGTNITVRASQANDGSQSDGDSDNPSLSDDGRYLVFNSLASTLVTGGNGTADIYLYDTVDQLLWLVTQTEDGNAANGDSFVPAISGDGQWIAVLTTASNLFADDTNSVADVVLFNRANGLRQSISRNAFGDQGNLNSTYPRLNQDGSSVLFVSNADNLVANDTNGRPDLFLVSFNGDSDGDGITDINDNCPAIANEDQANLDGDEFGDLCDSDRDGDGVDNGSDAFPDDANETVDSDGDGQGDNSDPFPLDAANDADGDGISGHIDNCPVVANEDQANLDGDAFGDLCDSDRDGDGVDNGSDAFPDDANETVDTDGDGQGDNSDPFPLDALNDIDGDGISGHIDNCPAVANEDQANLDGDAFGDLCDSDRDGDGVDNGSDAFPDDASETVDTDGDGQGDNSDPFPLDGQNDIDGDGVSGHIDNCPTVANSNQANLDGDAFGDLCDSDRDGDGVDNGSDAFPDDATETVDSDGDGQGDNSDPFPLDGANDIDGDGISGHIDNCPAIANDDQNNADGDAFGDLCDEFPFDAANDIDGDGIGAEGDNCPLTANPAQQDGDNDLLGDACDPFPLDADNDIDGDGISGHIDNCPVDANPLQTDSNGNGVGDACDSGEPLPAFRALLADKRDGFCIGIRNGNLTTGAIAAPSLCDIDQPGQLLNFFSVDGSSDTFQLQFAHSGLCLATEANVNNATTVQQACDMEATNQQFIVSETATGLAITTVEANGAFMLDSNTVEDEIVQFRPHGRLNQRWQYTSLLDGIDSDGDGFEDGLDAFPDDPLEWLDSDGDGQGDNADPFPFDADNDIDGDGIGGDVDNCPTISNPAQEDDDLDGIGDQCDLIGNPGDVQFTAQLTDLKNGLCVGIDNGSLLEGAAAVPSICIENQPEQMLDFIADAQLPNSYQLVFNHSGLCMDVENGSSVNNTTIVQTPCSDSLSQRFTFSDMDEVIRINVNTGNGSMVLDLNTVEGEIVQFRDLNGLNQRWRLFTLVEGDDSDGDGFADSIDAFPSDPSEWLDSDGDGTGDNADPFPFDAANDQDGDGFGADLDNCPSDFNPDQTDSDNDGRGDACDSVAGDDRLRFVAQLADRRDSLCITVANDSTAAEAIAIPRRCEALKASQLLEFLGDDQQPDQYQLRFYHSGLCLDVDDRSDRNNVTMVQRACEDSPSQWFRFTELTDEYRINTNTGTGTLVLDSNTVEDEVVQFIDFGSRNQRWQFFLELSNDDSDGDGVIDGLDAFPSDPGESLDSDGDGVGDNSDPFPFDADNDIDGDGFGADIDNCPAIANPDQADSDNDGMGDLCDIGDGNGAGLFSAQLADQRFGFCIGINQGSTEVGAFAEPQLCLAQQPEQLLDVIPVVDSADRVNFKLSHSGLCLAVENGTSANNATIVQMPCDDSVAQQFTLFDDGTELTIYSNTGSGDKVLDSNTVEDEIVQFFDKGGRNQRWQFINRSDQP